MLILVNSNLTMVIFSAAETVKGYVDIVCGLTYLTIQIYITSFRKCFKKLTMLYTTVVWPVDRETGRTVLAESCHIEFIPATDVTGHAMVPFCPYPLTAISFSILKTWFTTRAHRALAHLAALNFPSDPGVYYTSLSWNIAVYSGVLKPFMLSTDTAKDNPK